MPPIRAGRCNTSLADGGLVAEALTSIGFEIVEGADVNQNDMRRVFRDFLDKVQAAGPDAIAVVYYSGYAIQFEGDNYLIPVDARLERDSDIPIEAVRLFDLLRPLADAPALAKIVCSMRRGRCRSGSRADGSRPAWRDRVGARHAGRVLVRARQRLPRTGRGRTAPMRPPSPRWCASPASISTRMFARIRLRTHRGDQRQQTPWEVSQLHKS